MSDVLVIGGAGYIGSTVSRRLLEEGFTVKVLDNFLHGVEPVSSIMGNPRFSVAKGDIRDISVIFDAVKGTGTVIHLAAIVGDQACNLDDDTTVQVNLVSTGAIVEAAVHWGVSKLVFASTCSVYGFNRHIVDEASPPNPLSLYAKTKIQAEKSVMACEKRGVSPTVLRAGTVFGESPRMRFDLVVNTLTAQAVQDGRYRILGGDQWRPQISVKDISEAYVAVVKAPREEVSGEVFNVGFDEMNKQMIEVGNMIKTEVPSAEMVVEKAERDFRDYRVDFNKIRTRLKLRPIMTLVQGIREMRDAISAGKFGDYHQRKYFNYIGGLEDYYRSVYARNGANYFSPR